ncbi:MAG: High-affnity carbon uptake protein Hat/HatR [Bacteroidia bacterium]|nr:High-affnity carbon uptake protein Hat/HatR [Bacteroidia bacterium]
MGSKSETLKFNPFPGLRPFASEESDLFFGRETESREVMSKLLSNRFITVIGASGTGKSSLIYCGVLPKIRDFEKSDSSFWRMIMFRPGNDPFGNLGIAIAEHIAETGMQKVSLETVLLDMHLNADGITQAIKKYLIKTNEKVLLVVDQFEEIFRYSTLSAGGDKGAQASEFVGKIVSAVNQSDANIFTIVTMRSDFIGECAHYQGLTQLINTSNYLVPHMNRENYRQTIEGPVKYAGATIDQKLVDTILDDIGDRTDQLPVLQHALMRTWTYWQELDDPSRPLSHTDYDSVGTMSDAMSRHANEAYEELTPRGKEICEKMFKTITEKGTDNKGIRHPSSVNTLKSVIQCTSEELFDVVEKFRIPSRSFVIPRQDISLTDESIIDLSHESLMRLWDRLKDWVDDEAASVQMYHRLSEASAMYQQGKTSLLRPPDLQLAINWRDQQKPTLTWAERYNPAFERAMVYLRTSEKEYLDEEESKIRLQKRQIRRTKIIAMILGTAAIISGGFMLFAFVQKIAADKATQQAEYNFNEAELQKQYAIVQKDSAQIARERADSNAFVAELRRKEANDQRLVAEYQKTRAINNEKIAQEQRSYALVQKDSAQRARERALLSAEQEKLAKINAQRLRMLSIGKAMAVKSLQVQGQKDLQTLLAYQAYLFNTRNGGIENDADIYNGLYNVAKEYGNVNYKTFKHKGIRSIAFVPGKREFYTSGYDNQVLKWSLEGTNQTFQVVYSGNDVIEVLAVSPDASWLACGSDNSSIRMIPLKSNNAQYTLAGHTGTIKSLIFSFDGKYLYSAALDGKVLKWDMSTRTSTDITTGAMKITSIDISSNGKLIAGLNPEGNVILWNPESGTDNYRLPTELKEIKVIRFKPDENTLAIGDSKGNIELWDINTRQRISVVKAHTAQVNDIRFNPLLKQMATASNDNTLRIYNNLADLTEPPIILNEDDKFVLAIQFSPDGQLIVSGTYGEEQNLVSRPAHVSLLAKDVCTLVQRNLYEEEWKTYVARDIPWEKTCENKGLDFKVNIVR